MLRSTFASSSRALLSSSSSSISQSLRTQSHFSQHIGRRFASSSASGGSSSWRGRFVRLGLAGGVVYYYNTSPLFADEQAYPHLTPPDTVDANLPTIESIVAERNQRLKSTNSDKGVFENKSDNSSPPPLGSETPVKGAEELEEEAGQQGAFNPETGEINWDCPCLGGMADGPCGEDFKAAFSCFVFSEADPKGVDCIDKFKAMQDCFRKYPEVYGAELDDDEEDPTTGVDGQPIEAKPLDVEATKPTTPLENGEVAKVVEIEARESNPKEVEAQQIPLPNAPLVPSTLKEEKTR